MFGVLTRLSNSINAVLDEDGNVLYDENGFIIYDEQENTVIFDKFNGTILRTNQLKGIMFRTNRLYGTLRKIEDGSVSYDEYTGPYEVIPKSSDEQILETADKLVKRNITITKIPYFEVSNNSGGKTVTIGSEV